MAVIERLRRSAILLVSRLQPGFERLKFFSRSLQNGLLHLELISSYQVQLA